MEFEIIVQLVVVPIGATHLEPSLARLRVDVEVAIADNVGKVMAA